MKTYEIQIGDTWERVKGTTSGLREGWLGWKDSDGAQGLARPGTWRTPAKRRPQVLKTQNT